MNRLSALVVLSCFAACEGGTPSGESSPAFDVDVQISSSSSGSGCSVQWTATATDPGPLVTYQLGEQPNGPHPSWPTHWLKGGSFRGTTTFSYTHAIGLNVELHWIVSVGTWAEDKFLSFSCGTSWQEP